MAQSASYDLDERLNRYQPVSPTSRCALPQAVKSDDDLFPLLPNISLTLGARGFSGHCSRCWLRTSAIPRLLGVTDAVVGELTNLAPALTTMT